MARKKIISFHWIVEYPRPFESNFTFRASFSASRFGCCRDIFLGKDFGSNRSSCFEKIFNLKAPCSEGCESLLLKHLCLQKSEFADTQCKVINVFFFSQITEGKKLNPFSD